MWEGSKESEVGKEADTGIVRVRVNEKYYRPAEVEFLQGDCSKAKSLFEWAPKYDFPVSAQRSNAGMENKHGACHISGWSHLLG